MNRAHPNGRVDINDYSLLTGVFRVVATFDSAVNLPHSAAVGATPKGKE
jgi:hypothetical protein